jgi:hypothetical protein
MEAHIAENSDKLEREYHQHILPVRVIIILLIWLGYFLTYLLIHHPSVARNISSRIRSIKLWCCHGSMSDRLIWCDQHELLNAERMNKEQDIHQTGSFYNSTSEVEWHKLRLRSVLGWVLVINLKYFHYNSYAISNKSMSIRFICIICILFNRNCVQVLVILNTIYIFFLLFLRIGVYHFIHRKTMRKIALLSLYFLQDLKIVPRTHSKYNTNYQSLLWLR